MGAHLHGVDGRRGSANELKGCINDAHCMKYLLTTRLGFRDADIVMLTDDQNNPQAWPTRANMVRPKAPLHHFHSLSVHDVPASLRNCTLLD